MLWKSLFVKDPPAAILKRLAAILMRLKTLGAFQRQPFVRVVVRAADVRNREW